VDEDDYLVLTTGASNYAIGGCLLKSKKKKEEPLDFTECNWNLQRVSLFSQTLKNAERNYSVIEKELYAIVKGIEFNRHFLMSSKKKLIVGTDHANLMDLNKFTISKNRHVKWFQTINTVN
jgi:RNase H-like domain found in reverse transcriptase